MLYRLATTGKEDSMIERRAARMIQDVPVAFSLRDKLMLVGGAVACYALWRLLLQSASIPAEPEFFASLLADQPINALLLTAVGIPLMALLASVIVGRIRFEAGLFCALIGLIYLPASGGTSRSLLLRSSGPGIYLQLAVELAVLLGIIVATHVLLRRMPGQRLLTAPSGETPKRESMNEGLLAMGAQTLCTLVILMFIGQSPDKGQTMAAVATAALLSTLAVHYSYAVRGGLWYVSGTLLAGIVAYIYTYFRPAGMEIGEVRGMLAGAARSLPLHYATAGAAGALFGYWTSVVWHSAKNDVAEMKKSGDSGTTESTSTSTSPGTASTV
jgi:hypothetical protein